MCSAGECSKAGESVSKTDWARSIRAACAIRPYRLVRTRIRDLQSCDTGSNPVRGTKWAK